MTAGRPSAPRISVITPVYNPPAAALRAMLASVRAQTYGDWEHCLVDDASTAPHVLPILRQAARQDRRVRVVRRATNRGIVAASNDALATATGEFVALLDHDDELDPEALQLAATAIETRPDVDYLYSDEDKIDEAGRLSAPFFKPDWSPERMRVQMYTCHLSVLRRSLVDEVGGFDPEFEGSQDWDLVLRVTERARAVVHLPKVLYHWRTLPTSTASTRAQDAKPWAFAAGTRAIQAHCDRIGLEATVEVDPDIPGIHHLHPALTQQPLVSIIIPTAGARREVWGEETTLVTHCVRSIVATSTYENVELICVVDREAPTSVVDELRAIGGDRLRVVAYDRPFNYSEKINLGAIVSHGEHLLMLNDDMEVITPSFIERLVMYSRLPGMGAVGAKLFFGDGRIQHAGIVFGPGGPGHTYRGFARDYAGYFGNAHVAADYTAVTGACVMSPRKAFEEVGGLSLRFPLNFNDMDYCLKLQSKGYRVMFDPDAQLYHFESSSRSSAVRDWERDLLSARWSQAFHPDRFYHPAFASGSVDFVPPVSLGDGTLV